MNLYGQMLANISEMAATKSAFETRLRAYHAMCEKEQWDGIEVSRFEVITALEASLDAVAMTYRLIEQAKKHGC